MSREKKLLALTPPMGWNSWDCFGTSVTEDEVKANAVALKDQLAPHGFEYVVVDIQWSEPGARAGGYREGAVLEMDAYGRLVPASNRFPSARGGVGFKPLADFVHSLGLKFGIHVMRGVPRQAVEKDTPIEGTPHRATGIADPGNACSWCKDMVAVDMAKPGAQGYYDSIARLYASWGVDFIKADDMASPYHGEEIEAFSRAVRDSGRDIVLSLSPGSDQDPRRADHLKRHCRMWRVSSDLWDSWDFVRQYQAHLKGQFDVARLWQGIGEPGGWPDLDMLPLGRLSIRGEVGEDRNTRFTRDEQRTLMTLWCIFRSPLMMGGDLASLDEWTLSLLCNDEVLDVCRDSRENREFMRQGDSIGWIALDPATGGRTLALFNLGDVSTRVSVTRVEMGLPGAWKVRDLWEHRDMGGFEGAFTAELPAHGAGMYRITRRGTDQ